MQQGASTGATQLTGPPYIDVGPRSEQQLELRFLTHVQGHASAVATMRNEANGEYLFYNLTFNAAPPPIQGELKLNAPVRTLVKKQILLENPLPAAVTMKTVCENRQAWPSAHLACAMSLLNTPPPTSLLLPPTTPQPPPTHIHTHMDAHLCTHEQALT